MKVILTILLGVVAATCSAAEPGTLVSDPVAAVRKALPKGWAILNVKDHAYPFVWAKGDGKALYLGIPGRKKDPKEDYHAVLYIMSSEYADGGGDSTHGEAQTWPARLIMKTKDAKLYLWPGPEAEDWKTMQEDLLRAVIRSSEQSDEPNRGERNGVAR